MKLEVIQYTLRAKDELDMIIGTIENLIQLLYENDLDDRCGKVCQKLRETQRMACSARVALSDTFEEFCAYLEGLKNETE